MNPESPAKWERIIVRFPTTCVTCGKPVAQGQAALWRQGQGVRHLNNWQAPNPSRWPYVDDNELDRLLELGKSYGLVAL